MSLATGQTYDYSRAQSLTKQVYANTFEQMTPDSDKLAKEIDFVPSEKMPGNKYNQPVKLTRSMGITFSNTGGAFDLRQGLAPLDLNAEISGSQMVARELISYDLMERALKGDTGKGPASRAFIAATSDTVVNLTKSASYARELSLLYGGGATALANLGVVLNTTGSAGTSLVVQMDPKDWSTAIWAGAENGEFDIYSSAGAIRNSGGTDAARTNVFVLNTVDPVNYKVTFTSLAGNVSAVVATDQIFFAGQRTQDMVGLVAACTVTGANLWNINPSTYYLWKAQQQNVGGQLTFPAITAGLAKAAALGFNGVMNLHCSTQGWQDLCNDQTAAVRHADQKGGKVTFGYEDITFYSQVGMLRIKPNIYMKNGIAIAIPEGECTRVGSTDWTFNLPGYGKMIREVENKAGVEMRMYTDQALFCKHPGWLVYYSGIVNSI